MHILFLNQFFWPDEAPTGRLLEDVCRALVEQGHRVTVICGPADYRGSRSNEPPAGVRIVRVGAFRFARDRRRRLLSWLSFLAAAGLRALFGPRPDVIVTMTTPPGLSVAAMPAKMLRRSDLWIWEMDVYPDVAAAAGAASSSSWAYRWTAACIDHSRKAATGIVALGDCMKQRLVDRGVPAERIHVHENWSEIGSASDSTRKVDDSLRVLYAGNLGVAHEVDTIQAVLNALRDDLSVRFVFAGGGPRRAGFELYCKAQGLSHVEFLPHLSEGDFRAQLADCAVGLVTLGAGFTGTVVPSKFYSLLASGRPVLYVGPSEATPARHIRESGCGWAFESGQADAIASLLRRAAAEPQMLAEVAANSAALHRSRLARELAVPRLAARFAGENVAALPTAARAAAGAEA